jgi:hypothetical protein
MCALTKKAGLMSARSKLIGLVATAMLSSAAHSQTLLAENRIIELIHVPGHSVVAGAGSFQMLAAERTRSTLAQAKPSPKQTARQLHRELHIQGAVDQEVRVRGHVRQANDCGQGPIPDMKILKPPSIGTLTVRIETDTITTPVFGNCGPGFSGLGKVVYYRAANSGNDAFEYQMSSPGLPTTTWSVTVEIR